MSPTVPPLGRGGRDRRRDLHAARLRAGLGRPLGQPHHRVRPRRLRARQPRRGRSATTPTPRPCARAATAGASSTIPRSASCAAAHADGTFPRRRSIPWSCPTTTPRPTPGTRCGWPAPTTAPGSPSCSAAATPCCAKLEFFFSEARRDLETRRSVGGQLPAPVLLARQRARSQRRLPVRAAGRPDLDRAVVALDHGEPVQRSPRRRRRQRRRRHPRRLVRVRLARLVSGARHRPLHPRRARCSSRPAWCSTATS